MARDTIAAVATAPGVGAVGIVRLSGDRVPALAIELLGELPPPRAASLRPFRAADGHAIDYGLALYFPAPGSFTGEHVLELQGHGGPLVLDLLLERCVALGARVARPGEFSERAFLNGKLDLAQAEAVADLIESATELGARLAVRSLQGDFSRAVDALVEGLIRTRTRLEARLDFPDEELPLDDLDFEIGLEIDRLVADSRTLLSQARQGERIRDGITVAIAGPPNAGKSSLLNALAQQDAAIVTAIPGTTRDLLKVDIQLEGLPVRLVDTAGLRDSADPIEREGMRRAEEQIANADLLLWVYDAGVGYDPRDSTRAPSGTRVLYLRNKIDRYPDARDELPAAAARLDISALTGAGLDALRARIRGAAGLDGVPMEGAFLARQRHLDALRRGLAAIESAAAILTDRSASELAAADLRAAQDALSEITGSFTPDDLLGRIFSSFCIGK